MKPRALLGLPALAVVVACSPATPQPVAGPTPAPAQEAGPPAPAFASPAQWTLSRAPGWIEHARLATDKGELLVGPGGERWLDKPDGTQESAPTLAPAALVGVAKIAGGYRFVDAQGGVWESETALGPLAHAGDAPPKSERFALGKVALLATDAAGDLARSVDGGRTWSKVTVAPREGVLVALAMDGSTGLALAAPQRLFATKDDGQTWHPIASPGIGARDVRFEAGELRLEGTDTVLRFDPQTETFVPLAATGRRAGVPGKGTKGTTFERRVEGRRAVVIESNLDTAEHKVAIFELGASAPLAKKVDALDGCHSVHAALRGASVWLACDAPGSVESGIDRTAPLPGRYFPQKPFGAPRPTVGSDAGRQTGFVTKIVRSDDGGKSWVDEALVEGALPQAPDEAFAVGPDGWVFLGVRCTPSYPRVCLPARVRAEASGPFVDVGVPGEDGDSDEAVRYVRVASHATQAVVYALGVVADRVSLYQWAAGAPVPQRVAELGPRSPQTPSLSVDEDGTVRGVVPGDTPTIFELVQGKLTQTPLGTPLRSAFLAGRFGLGATMDGRVLETTDSGKTWLPVAAPSGVSVVQCSTEGCATTRGIRAGWDGKAAGGAAGSTAPPKHIFARGLKCTAKDAWVSLGGGQLPGVDHVDHAQLRWALPTRDAPGAVTLHTVKWGDAPLKTSRVPLTGPAPQPPKYGAATTMHVQPQGVVVLRYSYLRDRKGPGRYNPVDMQAAWYRWANGKIARASLAQIAPFRVNRDPQEGVFVTPPFAEAPEVLSLGPKGLWFRPPSFPDDEQWTLHHFRDDGKVERTKTEEGRGAVLRAVDLGGNIGLVGLEGTELDLLSPADRKHFSYSLLPGRDEVAEFLDVGGKTFVAATLRGEASARAWAIPLAATPDLAVGLPLPTQASLGDVPKGCPAAPAGPTEARIVAPWSVGSRRPVLVDADGARLVMATGRAVLRAPALGQTDACAVAFEAAPPVSDDVDERYSALVFLDDPSSSVLFRAKGEPWPYPVQARPMTCTFAQVPLPQALEDEDGFTSEPRPAPGARR
jgi:photosystem II stability/assembly factor-like uncharacterized protein